MRLPKPLNSRKKKGNDSDDDDQEEDVRHDLTEKEKKKKEKHSLTAILSKTPSTFPWLLPALRKSDAEEKKLPSNQTGEGLSQNDRLKTSAFQIFEKKNNGLSAPTENTTSTIPSSSNSSMPQFLLPNKQQINFKIKQQKTTPNLLEKLTKDKNDNEEKKNADGIDEERENSSNDENTSETGYANIPAKALCGETLLRRATKVTKKGVENIGFKSNTNDLFPSKSSMIDMLDSAKLGLMTEAHREAAMSEWRRKSDALMRQLKKQDNKAENEDDMISIGVEEDDNGEILDVDDQLAKEILADVEMEEAEARARKRAKKSAKKLKKEKEKAEGKNRTENDVKEKKKQKHKNKNGKEKMGDEKTKKKTKRKDLHEREDEHKETKKQRKEIKSNDVSRSRSRSRSKSRSRSNRRRHQSRTRSPSSRRSRSRTRSRLYTKRRRGSRSTNSSKTYSRSRSRSSSPLPPFNRHRAMETRRRLIEQSWHRRIEQSVRPVSSRHKSREDISPIRKSSFDKSDYMDDQGKIDKQKLLDIATKNATKLAMEGKLPKGAEILDTIKNKSVEQLIGLCKKLQNERDLLPKGSSSDEDDDRRYSRHYDNWRDRRDRSKDREFRSHGVRSTAHPSTQKYLERDRKEMRRREENHLRLEFPVSSGVQHRKKTEEPLPEYYAGPLVRVGEIGPLTVALAKVRTNLTSAYRPLSQPLATSQPTSSLSTHFRSTSSVAIGPIKPPETELKPLPPPVATEKKVPPSSDIVNSKAYEIALAAAERTAELEKEKTKEPMLATSASFIGPTVPKLTAMEIIAAITPLPPTPTSTTNETTTTPTAIALPPPQPMIIPSTSSTESAAQPNKVDPTPAKTMKIEEKPIEKQSFSSSWDKPGHIAAREAFLKKMIAEQKKKADEAAAVEAKAKAQLEAKIEQQKQHEQKLMEEKLKVSFLANTEVNATENTPSSSAAINTNQSAQSPSAVGNCEKLPTADVDGKDHPVISTAKIPASPNATDTKTKSQFPKTNLTAQTAMAFVPSTSRSPMILPTTSSPNKPEIANTKEKKNTVETEAEKIELIDKMHAYVEAQVARQKAESVLHATILTAQMQQKAPPPVPKNELSIFATHSRDPIGLTKQPKSIQELIAERIRYNLRLQRDPNDYDARKEIARIENEMTTWSQDSTLPGEFTGHTGARVLSEKELEPMDPRFHAWAKKDQFRNAPEVNSGVGMRLMEKMGWKPGQGLGKDEAGQLEPLALDVKSDKRGFYSGDLEKVPRRESVLDPTGKNPISILMEVCSRNRWHFPDFTVVETGPQNNKRYHWKAVMNGTEYQPSLASSNKKAGKAQVCMVILESLGLTS